MNPRQILTKKIDVLEFVTFIVYLAFLLLMICAQAFAESAPQAINISLNPGSTCGSPNLALVGFGDSITEEAITVTDENNSTIYQATNTHAPETWNGLRNYSFNLANAAGKSTGLLAISYSLQSQLGFASFYMVLDCGLSQSIYECAENGLSCPKTMADFFPHLDRDAIEEDLADGVLRFSNFTLGKYGSDSESLYIYNRGVLGLQLLSATLEGPDKDQFEVENAANLPSSLIETHDYKYIEIILKPTGGAGLRQATLRLVTSDPFAPEIVIPLRANVQVSEALAVWVKNAKLEIKDDTAIISATIVVKNEGSKASRPGARLTLGLFDENTVREDCSYDECSFVSRYMATILDKRIGRIRPNKQIMIQFKSKPLSVGKHRLDRGDSVVVRIAPTGGDFDTYDNSESSNF